MGNEPAAPQQSRSDRIITLISGISTWKQALILVVLGFAVLGGIMVYQHPEWIGAMFAADDEPTLVSTERMAKELPGIRRDLHAEIVVVFGTAPERNECWVLAYDASPEIADIVTEVAGARTATKLPLFTGSGAWNTAMIGVLDGESPCVATDETPETELVKRTGVVEVCVVGLPPGPEALVGVLVAGFKEPRDRPARTRVRNALRSTALAWMQ